MKCTDQHSKVMFANNLTPTGPEWRCFTFTQFFSCKKMKEMFRSKLKFMVATPSPMSGGGVVSIYKYFFLEMNMLSRSGHKSHGFQPPSHENGWASIQNNTLLHIE